MSTRTREARPPDLHAWRSRDLPPLTPLDRAALRLGLALILWGRRGSAVDRSTLSERHRTARLAREAELHLDRAVARRHPGGQIL